MARHSRVSLLHDLERLGIQSGDTVLVRGDVLRVGKIHGGPRELIHAFLDAVGPEGTVMALAFTEQFFVLKKNPEIVFSKESPSKSGALTRLFLELPEIQRSAHPTNSFIAHGPLASALLSEHSPESDTYLPVRRLIDHEGKMIIFGCVENSPGFTTVHTAQEELGLAARTPFKNLFGSYYEVSGERKLFLRNRYGGCSLGFSKFYSDYIAHEKLQVGSVGGAYALAISAKDAYAIESKILAENPRYALCDRPLCPFCRGFWWYNKRDMPLFYLRYFAHFSQKLYQKVYAPSPQ